MIDHFKRSMTKLYIVNYIVYHEEINTSKEMNHKKEKQN